VREELIHFLSHVYDEEIMTAVIRNLNLESMETLFQHLAYTSRGTQERWMDMCGKVLVN